MYVVCLLCTLPATSGAVFWCADLGTSVYFGLCLHGETTVAACDSCCPVVAILGISWGGSSSRDAFIISEVDRRIERCLSFMINNDKVG